MSDMNDNWERQALKDIALAGLTEQRRARRWGIFFKSAFLLYFILVLVMTVGSSEQKIAEHRKPHTAIVDIKGPIAAGSEANASLINKALRKAFDEKQTKGVVLRINSPGGSPVQSDYIFNEIMRLRYRHPDTKVYAVCEDSCASGAYYIAAAADKIFANPSSLVGSIGVLFQSFGAVDGIKKLGVTRRLFTSGTNKGSMDPFLPVNPQTRAHMQEMLDDIHQTFIKRVEQGRKDKLNLSKKDIFSGRVWTGNEALQYGLIDGFASPREVAVKYIKEKRMVNYTYRPNSFERLAQRFGASLGMSLSHSLMGLFNNESGRLS